MLSRRALFGKLAAGTAGAAVVLAGGAGRAKATSTLLELTDSIDAKARELLPLAPQGPDESAQATTASAAEPLSAPPPWELLQPLALGSTVAHGWRVAQLSTVVDGACVLTLENQRGRSHRVHLCRNDGRPQGLVYTERLDLVVMNGGRGDLPTEEGLAQAVAEVAHVLAANEAGAPQRPVVVALLPHAERVRRYAPGADARLR